MRAGLPASLWANAGARRRIRHWARSRLVKRGAMGLLDELLGLEHARWRSLCEGGGASFYGSVMTEYAVMVPAHGGAMGRDAVAGSLGEAPARRAVMVPAEGGVVGRDAVVGWLEEAPSRSGSKSGAERLVSVGEAAWALV